MGSTRIGCTKIQENTWTEESQRISIGKIGEKKGGGIVFMPTQRYDTPSGKFGKRFVGILSVEIVGVCVRKWNSERVIIFQSVILQHAQGVNNPPRIHKRVLFRLDFWNCGAFDIIVKDVYNLAMGYLIKPRGIQAEEQRHQTFSNLVLKGKLRKEVQFFCDREKGEVFQPDELDEDCTCTISDTVTSVLEGKYQRENSLLCHVRNVRGNVYFCFFRHHGGSSQIGRA